MVTGHDLKQDDQATFLSPAEAEGSKEIFGLIKKLNGVPDTRKKAKIPCMILTIFMHDHLYII